tara:strand:- start:132 stop:632 length:501 start_codon:yes stop_codon:yes gene_type:complete
MLEAPGHYHYKYMMDCYKNDNTISDYINNYVNNINLISAKELENNATQSINELKKRYEHTKRKYTGKNIFIIYSGDYIEQNYKDKLLFYSMNHPTFYLLKFISESIIIIINCKKIQYNFYEIDNSKCIQKIVNFDINKCKLLTKNKNTLEDICTLYYNTYKKINFY